MMKDVIVVIQAGGKGTRMSSLTGDKIPKPLLALDGKPMIEWQIEAAKRYGVTKFVLIIGHLGEKIKEYFGDGKSLGVEIEYIEESIPLGSAGALFYLRDYPADKYLLIFGDVIFDINLDMMFKFHEKKGAIISLAAHPNAHPYDSDLLLVDSDDRVTGILGKKEERDSYYSNLVNAGICLFQHDVLDEITEPVKMDWEQEIVQKFIPEGKVYGYRTSEYIKDAGTPERFKKSSREHRLGLWERKNLQNKQKCVFLDRDGTINNLVGLVDNPDKLTLYDMTDRAIRILNSSGMLVILVTNQPVVARGMCSEEDVRQIHRKLETLLGQGGAYLDDIAFCPHHPDKGYPEENPIYKIDCDCRKPKTGMITAMADKYNIDLAGSYIIGDTTSDIKTGINSGLHTILLKTGEAGKDGKYDVQPEAIVDNLLEAVYLIIRKEKINMDYTKDIREYLEAEREVLQAMDENEISEVMNVLEETRLSGNRVFICGNGGSAATASHFTCDFNKGVSYSQTVKYNFECLNDNVPMMMAIANDISYEDIFSEPLKNKMHKEDVLFAISGSGNSKNVVKAVEYAKSIGAKTVGLVGYDGGQIKTMVDYCIHVKINNMQIVEDVHMAMDHVMMYVLSGMKGC